ncbi:MAG: glycosyltransferase family 39 protein, partial [Chloroflexota bacterium]|nr:glycosyltransferase family 39 protein [Chloroflexota bacterium]
MATAGKVDSVATDSVAPSTARVRRLPALIWKARGFFGGLIAIGLAALGQQTLLSNGGSGGALSYYVAAIVLLIASLLHPNFSSPRLLRRGAAGKEELASTGLSQTMTEVPRAELSTPAHPSSLPARAARSHTDATLDVRASERPWARWKALRARLGWRATGTGLALTLALAGWSAFTLNKDIASALGGWLWGGSLLALLATFAGAPPWPRGAGLLPGPYGDFFGRGVPRVPARWEALLVGAMLLVALGMRLANLEYFPGIFGDEGERGMDARAIEEGQQPLLFGYGWWQVPNLYFYLVSFMLRIFGDNMVGDRMLSVISGVVAVWFVYRTGRLLWGARAGLVAGALLAVSPVALQFSRQAGESTPTGALWAVGFYFLCMALRYRRWSDWALSGIAWGFSLYFYAAGKLIIPLVLLVALYCLARWRLEFFKRYAPGFLLLGLAFGLTFMPYGIFSYQDHWQGFTGRAQETSIFSPQNQVAVFARHGIPYDPSAATQPLAQQLLAQPLPWAQVLYNQMRVTIEVLYRSGDPTFFYKNTPHGGSLLSPLLAALALLGLAYGTWKLWDARFGLVCIWFWVGMLGPALTMDTPSVQRITGAWPALMLFPAVLLDRIFAAGWPLNVRLARRWVAVPLAALLIFFGADGYQDYFVSYAATCPYCDATAQARYAVDLGQDYKAYQMGVGGYDVFFTYGPTRFLAKGVEGIDVPVPAELFPITNNNGKGAAFIVYRPNYDYLPIIRLFYPGGKEEVIKSADGMERFTSYKISRQQMAGFQALHATYRPKGGRPVERVEPNLGTSPSSGEWSSPPGLAYPASATWQGGLVAPAYGAYTFQLSGPPDARLE